MQPSSLKSPFDWDKTGRMHVVVFYLKGVIIIPLILQENISFLFNLKSTSLASLVVPLFQEVQLGQEVP